VPFPEWRQLLELEPLEGHVRYRRAQAIIRYLGHCTAQRRAALVADAIRSENRRRNGGANRPRCAEIDAGRARRCGAPDANAAHPEGFALPDRIALTTERDAAGGRAPRTILLRPSPADADGDGSAPFYRAEEWRAERYQVPSPTETTALHWPMRSSSLRYMALYFQTADAAGNGVVSK